MAVAHAGWLLSGGFVWWWWRATATSRRVLWVVGNGCGGGCGVWTEVKRPMDKEVGGPWAKPIVS